MASKTTCDCGCGIELGQYDAGRVPMILRGSGGVELRVEVVEKEGRRPNLRPGCVQGLLTKAEQVYPPKPQRVVDPAAAEPGDELDVPGEAQSLEAVRPLRAAGGEA